MVKGKIPVVYLDVGKIKNQPFILDTGAETTGLNLDDAARLATQLVPCPKCKMVGSGDSAGVPMSLVPSIKLQYGKEFEIKGRMLAATSLGCITQALGTDIAGIIGFEVLSGKIDAMDFVHHEFVLLKSEELADPVRSSAVVLQFAMDPKAKFPVIPAVVGVKDKALGQARVEIDTGADSMTIYRHFAEDHGLENPEGWKPGKSCGNGGLSGMWRGADGWAQFGNERLTDTAVNINLATKGIAAQNQEDVLLSSAMLDGWIVVFNRKAGHILLIKPQTDKPTTLHQAAMGGGR